MKKIILLIVLLAGAVNLCFCQEALPFAIDNTPPEWAGLSDEYERVDYVPYMFRGTWMYSRNLSTETVLLTVEYETILLSHYKDIMNDKEKGEHFKSIVDVMYYNPNEEILVMFWESSGFLKMRMRSHRLSMLLTSHYYVASSEPGYEVIAEFQFIE